MTRTNPYFKSGAFSDIRAGLKSFEVRQCSMGINALLDPTSPSNPAFNSRTEGNVAQAQLFFDRLQKFAFNGQLDTQSIAAGAVQPAGAVLVDRRVARAVAVPARRQFP